MSRDSILASIKEAGLKKVELDVSDINLTTYEDKLEAFKEALKKAGGEAIECKREEILDKIIEFFGEDKKIISYIKECKAKNVDTSAITKPQELKDVDIAIVEGRVGVAENGAIWCDDSDVEQNAIFFITKTLIILLDKNRIVNNIHEAYQKIGDLESSFGVFISGPSKTADIEQSLVLGAHGAIKCWIILFN